jgi:hypothetical protein
MISSATSDALSTGVFNQPWKLKALPSSQKVTTLMSAALPDSDGDELIRLQLEDEFVVDTLMVIDSANLAGGIRILAGFAAALLAMILIGVLGPAAIIQLDSPRFRVFNDGVSHSLQQFPWGVGNLTTFNRFVRVAFSVRRNDVLDRMNESLRYKYEFRFREPKNEVVDLASELFEHAQIVMKPGRNTSSAIVIYSEVIITYSSFNVSLILQDPPWGLVGARINARFGNPRHTYFQMVFRVAFSLAVLVCWRIMLRALRRVPVRLWHLEQKMTLPLLVLAFLYNDPLYCVNAARPRHAYFIFDTIVRAVFVAYFRFFILALFDSLRFKNRKVTAWFYISKLSFIMIMFASTVVHGIYDDITLFVQQHPGKDNLEEGLRGTELALYRAYIVWAGITIVNAGVVVDVTESHKFYLYCAGGVTAVGTMAIVHLLFESFVTLRRSSLRFVVGSGVENLFVLLMAYYHWPHALLTQKDINKANAAGTETAGADTSFFVHE